MKRLTLALLLWAASAAGADPASLQDLRFLIGRWGGPMRAGMFQETWTEPMGNSMHGVSTIVDADGKVVFREFMLIEETGEGLVLTVQHFGPALRAESGPVQFRLSEWQSDAITWTNPAHDHPQRIVYRRRANGGMVAIVDRLDGTQRLEFPMEALADASREIVLSARVTAPMAEVWQAWSSNAGAESFFAPKTNIRAEVGGPYEIFFDPSAPAGQRGAEDVRVHSLIPGRSLTFQWSAPPQFPSCACYARWCASTCPRWTPTPRTCALPTLALAMDRNGSRS